MRIVALILLPLLLLACGGGGGGGDNISWDATFTGGESSGSSSGGVTIGASGTTKTGWEWVLAEPFEGPADLPPADPGALDLARALLVPEAIVVDAVLSPAGVLALATAPDGSVWLAAPEAGAEIRVPDEPARLFLTSAEPIEVLLAGPSGSRSAVLLTSR